MLMKGFKAQWLPVHLYITQLHMCSLGAKEVAPKLHMRSWVYVYLYIICPVIGEVMGSNPGEALLWNWVE